ncbi:MAG: pilus assembly protein CpaF [Actinomycetota bacterium]|jgi:tight adherence protein B
MITSLLVPLVIGIGLTAVVVGLLLRAKERDAVLESLLDLARRDDERFEEEAAEAGISDASALDISNLTRGAVSLAGRLVAQIDAQGALAASLERARIPLRAGEYAVVGMCGAVVSGLLVGTITASWILGGIMAFAAIAIAVKFPSIRIARRRKALASQLPDALSLIASSLSAGHTFLRAIQMMCEEADPPLSDEFGRVVFEVRLGAPLVDALDRMAHRVEVPDLAWVVQAIRIQQTVGGKLADLLHTLADFIRARDEVRREVAVLTAEGRVSAWILGGMPVFLILAIQTMNPGYAAPLFHGAGLIALAFTGVSIVAGVGIILKMVRIEI